MPTANAVQRLARSFSEEALRTLVELMRTPEVRGNVRVEAAEAVLNRGIGLPAVAIDVSVQPVLAKKLCECTIDELRAIEAHLAEQAIDVTPAADTVSVEPKINSERLQWLALLARGLYPRIYPRTRRKSVRGLHWLRATGEAAHSLLEKIGKK